jgi:CHAD domain-containing protein
MSALVEREIKLAVDDDFRMPDLTGVLDGVTASAAPGAEILRAVYYDTPDLRLVRRGITLRHRVEAGKGVWTLKLPMEGEHLTRRELSIEGRPAKVPEQFTRLVRGHVRRASLGSVARLTTRRQTIEVSLFGHRLLEVADDRVSSYEGRRVATRVREVEVELVGPAPARLVKAVVAALEDRGATSGGSLPKVVRALGPLAMAEPEAAPKTLSEMSTIGEAIESALAASVTRLLRYDPGVRLGEDPEDLHQMRVATRRMRSDLRTFRDLVEHEWAAGLRDELKWLADALGHVRDADVLLERLQERCVELPPQDAKHGGAIIQRLHRERDAHRAALVEILDSDRYGDLVEALVVDAQHPHLATDGLQRAQAVLPGVVSRPWKHLEQAMAALGKHPVDEQLHEVRIRAKRARYAAEAATPVCGKPAKRMGSALAEAQGILGDLQDAVVAEDWLRTAGSRGPAVQALVAGELIAAERREMDATRRRWARFEPTLDAKKLRGWLS